MSHLQSVSKYSIHHFLEGRDDGGDNFSRHNLSPHKHPTIGEKGRSSNSTQDCSAFATVHISTKIFLSIVRFYVPVAIPLVFKA